MLKHLEAKHELFNGVNEMIAPETLSDLTERKTTRATEKPIEEHGGVSGSQMSFIGADAGRYFMKCMSMESDCIMLGSNDMMCRSVALWQYGILDQIRPMVEYKITLPAHAMAMGGPS